MHCPTLKDLPPPPAGKTGWPWTEETSQLPETMPDGSSWPRISIVTPSYNQGEFIEETVRAVLLQGYPNLEYIIIDDGSTDNSIEVIKKYEPWVKILLENENRGMSHAINKGFEICSGDIITWIASDDIYLKGAFYNVGCHWPKLKAYGATAGAFHFMDKNSKMDQVKYVPKLPHEGPMDLTLVSLGKWRLHQVSTFYISYALDNVGRFVREDLHHNMDRELLYRICKNYKVLLIYEALAAFRIHSKSKSWSLSNLVPMAKEYASIQYMFLTDNNKDNLKRKKIARYRIAKGYIRYAKHNPAILKSVAALITALFYKPSFIVDKGYITAWLKVLHILLVLKRLKCV